MKDIKNKLDKSAIFKDKKTREIFEQELENILSFKDAIDRLVTEMTVFDKNLDDSLKHNEFLDVKLARELFVTSAGLLRVCQKEQWAEHVPFSLAAISYFLNPNDGHDDRDDIDGYEDDKQVLIMVIKQFNLQSKIESEVKEMQKNGEIKSA